MSCTTAGCPAPKASSPRKAHSAECHYSSARSGTPGVGNPAIRVRPDIAVLLHEVRALRLEDEAVSALRTCIEKGKRGE